MSLFILRCSILSAPGKFRSDVNSVPRTVSLTKLFLQVYLPRPNLTISFLYLGIVFFLFLCFERFHQFFKRLLQQLTSFSAVCTLWKDWIAITYIVFLSFGQTFYSLFVTIYVFQSFTYFLLHVQRSFTSFFYLLRSLF